jgi:hypothetical protein
LWITCGSTDGMRKQKYFETFERLFVIMKGVIWRIIIESGKE